MEELCFKCGRKEKIENMYKGYAFLCRSCYEELLKKYKGKHIYRFVSPEAFFLMIDSKKLTFTLPSRWSDSFEDIFFKELLVAKRTHLLDPIYIREMLAQRDSYYCQCWTLTQESQFFWKAYGFDNSAIRIEIDLAEAFDMGIRIEPVTYSSFLLQEEWIREQLSFGVKFAKGNEQNLYWVDEDGYYHGDISIKTAEMRYAMYIITILRGMHENCYRYDVVPLPQMIATKQTDFAIENEVRLFLDAFSIPFLYGDKRYFSKHQAYITRLYKGDDADLNTHMPNYKTFSFAKNRGFIKSILCHPYMSDETFQRVYSIVKEKNLVDRFLGRSTLFTLI